MRPLLVLLCLLTAAGCGAAPADPVRAPEGWTTFRDAEHGVTVRFPSTWHRATRPLTPFLTGPRERLSLGTFAADPNGTDDCAPFPVEALREAGPRDVFVTLHERQSGQTREFAQRDRPFIFGAADRSVLGACLRGGQPWRSYWVPFHDEDRTFYVLAVIGREAPAGRVSQLREVLDSLAFDPLAAEE